MNHAGKVYIGGWLRRLCVLGLLLFPLLALSACSGGGGGSSGSTSSATGSNWDQMNWDQGHWG